ncbi:PilZ domain-containing protein [Sphingomonas sp. KR1UV-12]|uniref:PilZ domain-containing protein n=1 Tax=Sphingomonas aurea TaxID=3063994 RepID=A0ABT9EHK9_9SPHN|nr:PilZ domain-containing protein [Sphingomonas sp. KR1UV-12]MDP1026263.1 PilZ domain-containing protein [Sphingomonas sp. KR1UV-12]
MDGFIRDTASQPDTDTDGAEQRTHLRAGMLLMAALRLGDETTTREVRIRNLSEQGLMAEPGEPVPVGIAVTLDLPGVGEVSGTVAWSAEGRIGVALARVIDIALVNAARSGG